MRLAAELGCCYDASRLGSTAWSGGRHNISTAFANDWERIEDEATSSRGESESIATSASTGCDQP